MRTDLDEQVWVDVLRSDDAAFAVIWDRHFGRIKAHLVRLTRDIEEAEELAALSLLEGWRRRRTVRFVDGSALPWLLVTASNLQRNSARARRRYANVLARAPRAAEAMDPAEAFERTYINPALRDALNALSADDLALLILVALEGVSVKDAAKAIGLAESAGRMRLARLRSRLQAHGDLRTLMEGSLS